MQSRKYIPKLTYALNGDNQLVHIDTVNNGKECNCFCPCCRNPLVARNNSIHIQHHFAHADEVDCGKAFESALHLLAKQIFEKEKSLMLPRYKTVKACVHFFDGVETEQRVDALDIQPDSVGISNGHRILVEFKNTHAIDDTKKQKIADLKLTCVEIDISEQELDEDAFTKFLLSSTEKRIWINAPQLEEEHIANKIKAKEAFRNKQRLAIESYLNEHPLHKFFFPERCDNCPHDTAILKWRRFIKQYEVCNHKVVHLISQMAPLEIIENDIGLEYTHRTNSAYIRINDCRHYIYPPRGSMCTPEEETQNNMAYKFCKNYPDVCWSVVSDQCRHYVKQLKYDGKYYIVCKRLDMQEKD